MPRDEENTYPSSEDLIEALAAPGRLLDQPAIQALLEARKPKRPVLTLIPGGRNDAR